MGLSCLLADPTDLHLGINCGLMTRSQRFKTRSAFTHPAQSHGTVPFNLQLTEEERKAKDGVVLPYTKEVAPSKGVIYVDPVSSALPSRLHLWTQS